MRHRTAILRLLFFLTFLALFVAAPSFAQDAKVTRNVYLRPEPSTSNTPIKKLLPPDELELIQADPVDGYYRVRTVEDEEEGWVWGRNIRIISAGAPAGPTDFLAASPAPEPAISESWAKPPLTVGSFTSSGKTCGPTGSADGNETNRRKNRVDVPSSYRSVTFDAFMDLPDVHIPKDRARWDDHPAERDQVAAFEGIPIRMIGYLVAIKPQTTGSGETTNCKWKAYKEVDWHMALVEEAGQGERLAAVVETTPRIRRNHPKWTEANLAPWLDTDEPVRISGWLLFDPEHRNHMDKYRKSMWEIHPITKIEVWKDDKWVDLDGF